MLPSLVVSYNKLDARFYEISCISFCKDTNLKANRNSRNEASLIRETVFSFAKLLLLFFHRTAVIVFIAF